MSRSPVIALAFLTFAFIVSIAGCCKQEKQAAPPHDSGAIDPYDDLVALLDGPHHTLYVLPEKRDTVLRLLHAYGSGDRYIMEVALDVYQEAVPIGFQVRPVTLTSLIDISVDIPHSHFEFENWYASRDSTRGTFIDTLAKEGVYYRIYKNAECKEIEKGKETDCEYPFWEEEVDSTKPPKPLNYYVKRKFYPISHCQKGNAYCVEALGISIMTEYYDNKGCSGAPYRMAATNFDFSCVGSK